MKFHRQYDWYPLSGETVQIRNHGEVIRDGLVEAVTRDDSILWLAADGALTRQMICRAEGNEAWITYKWDTTGTNDQTTASTRAAGPSAQKRFPSIDGPAPISP